VIKWLLICLALVGLIWLFRRVLLRKWVAIALASVIVLAPIVIATSLLYSETGLRLARGQLTRLERFGVYIEGVSGTLAGPLRVERFELKKPNVHIISHDIVVYPRIRQLLIQTIGVRALTARDTSVEILRAPQQPPPTKPLRFLPSFMRVTVDNAQFTTLRYVNIDGTTIDAQRLEGEATLTSEHIRVKRFETVGSWFDVNGDLTLTAGRPLGLELTTHGTVTQRNVRYVIDGVLDGTIDELGIKAQLREPSAADVNVTLTRPNESWRIAGTVRSPQFSLQPWVERPPFSIKDAALDVIVEPAGIQANGTLVVPEVDAQPLELEARGRYAKRVITIDAADVAMSQSPARVHASGTVALNGAASAIDAHARWAQLQWPLRGTAIVSSRAGSGTLRGTLPYQFSVDAHVVGPKVPATTGTASGTIAKDSIVLDAFDVGALGGRATGTGSLAFAQPRHWQLSAQVREVDPAQLDERFPGRLSVNVAASGQGLDKRARFIATLRQLNGTLREQRVRGEGGIDRDAQGWRVRNAQLEYGDAKLALNGELRETIEATWSFNAPSLESLHPDARGTLIFNGSASGPVKTPHIVLDLRGARVGYAGWRAQLLTASGDLDLSGANASRLAIEAQEIGAASPLIDSLRASGEGTADNHRIALEVIGRPTTPSEPAARAEVRIEGRYSDAAWNAAIHSTEINPGTGDRLALVEPGRLQLNRERALLDPLCFAMGNGRLCAEAKWQRNGPWDATVSGYELPLAAFLPPSGPDTQYGGRIEGRVRAFGAPKTLWQGEAGMRIVDASIIYRPQGAEPETLNLGTGGLAATATPERINFSFGVQAFTDTFLFANANIDRTLGTALTRAPLVGDFRARAADANILPIVFPDIDNAAGLLTANGTVKGTLASPQIDGRIELANGEFDSYRVNLALRDLNLIANLAGNELFFNGKGRAGEGALNVGGRFAWQDGVSRGNLQLRGENLLVADLPDYRVVASPDLNFAIDGRNLNATGTVTIPSALVQPADLSGSVQASEDARYVGEHPAEESGRYIVNSDVRVNMGDDVRVDSFGLQGRIVGGVSTTIRTGEAPIGRGELSVAEGRYEAYGQKLEISRGKLLFEGSSLSDPALDIEARRKVETVTVGLNVRGTLQQPRLSFFSEPTMPQTQIVSYLLVGKPIDSMQGNDAATVSSARDAIAMQGGGLLASQLGRRIGLEEVGVESTTDSAGETNQQLVLGKFLSPRLFISYGISLTESINTLKLRYTISDRWTLKSEAGENQSADIEFTVER
jgi:translocation and assembly module TamB